METGRKAFHVQQRRADAASTEHPGSPWETQHKSGTGTSVQPGELWIVSPDLNLLCHRARRGLGTWERLGKGQQSCPQLPHVEG